MNKSFMKDKAYGVSPLGGNSVEGTDPHCAPVRDASVQAVPLVYDSRAGSFVSEQAVDDLDDRDDSIGKRREWERDQSWRALAGVTQAYKERT